MRCWVQVLLLMVASASLFAKSTIPPPPAKEHPRVVNVQPQKRGRWHMAEDGHAVFCYGPVITINTLFGVPKRVATQCKGRSEVVPLHE
jgi:hypothetical protein